MRRILVTVLTILGFGCALMFLSYEYSVTSEKSPQGMSERKRTTLGLSFSPWYEWETRMDSDRTTTSGGVQLISWSWPVFLLGVGCLSVAWNLSRGKKPATPLVGS